MNNNNIEISITVTVIHHYTTLMTSEGARNFNAQPIYVSKKISTEQAKKFLKAYYKGMKDDQGNDVIATLNDIEIQKDTFTIQTGKLLGYLQENSLTRTLTTL